MRPCRRRSFIYLLGIALMLAVHPAAAMEEQGAIAAATRTITVTFHGSGAGSVTSQPEGLNCSAGTSPACSASFADGTTVVLTATPVTGSDFLGWGGACSGSEACTVTVASDVLVEAIFEFKCSPCGGVLLPFPKGGCQTGSGLSSLGLLVAAWAVGRLPRRGRAQSG
jgi:hypothetical protein